MIVETGNKAEIGSSLQCVCTKFQNEKVESFFSGLLTSKKVNQ